MLESRGYMPHNVPEDLQAPSTFQCKTPKISPLFTREFPKIGDPNIYSTLNSRILIVRTPKSGTPNFRKLPFFISRQWGLGFGIQGFESPS